MKRTLAAFTLACVLSSLAFSNADADPAQFRAGLRNSDGKHRLKAAQLTSLLDSLSHKTGWLELRFDGTGYLMLGDRTRYAGGSASARELLCAAVDGDKIFELEVYDRSPEIAFAHLTPGTIRENDRTGARIEIQQVQLDFADFAELRGEREVLAAFDAGIAVLHELVHGVLHLHDAVGERNQLGACDEQINRMRRELGLPERTAYNPRLQEVMSTTRTTCLQAALTFVAHTQTEAGRVNKQRFSLRWEAAQVGRVVAQKR